MTRVRVLYFSNVGARGGAEEHMLGLLHGLDRERFLPYLACPAALLAQLQPLPADVRICPHAPRQPWQLGPAMHLMRFLRRERIAVVHAHLACSSRAVAPWARLADTPVVLETPHVREQWRHGWRRAYGIDRGFGRWLDGYIAVSDANADYLRRDKRLPGAKIWTIPNGIDLRRFARPTVGADPRPALGIAPDELLAVCAARLEPQKGHTVLLQAMAGMARGRGPRLRLVCLGAGRLEAELHRQAQELGLGSQVLFAGFRANVPDWLATADIFVLPSWYEGLPLAALEAGAAGCACLATAVDGTPEVIEDGVTGLLVPPGDAGALARSLERLAADPLLRRRLGAAARARVSARFDLRRQVADTSQLYLHLLHAKLARGQASAAPAAALGGARD